MYFIALHLKYSIKVTTLRGFYIEKKIIIPKRILEKAPFELNAFSQKAYHYCCPCKKTRGKQTRIS